MGVLAAFGPRQKASVGLSAKKLDHGYRRRVKRLIPLLLVFLGFSPKERPNAVGIAYTFGPPGAVVEIETA